MLIVPNGKVKLQATEKDESRNFPIYGLKLSGYSRDNSEADLEAVTELMAIWISIR